jgi:hypothetical protein
MLQDVVQLDKNAFQDHSFENGEELVKGGTPGAMFLLLVNKLMGIKKIRPEAYALIEQETEWMIALVRKIIISATNNVASSPLWTSACYCGRPRARDAGE